MSEAERPPREGVHAGNWLDGLIKPEPQPLPPRPPEADSFAGGRWVAGLPESSALGPSDYAREEELRREQRRGKPKELPTAEVDMGTMLAKAAEAESNFPRDAENRFMAPERPAWARPEGVARPARRPTLELTPSSPAPPVQATGPLSPVQPVAPVVPVENALVTPAHSAPESSPRPPLTAPTDDGPVARADSARPAWARPEQLEDEPPPSPPVANPFAVPVPPELVAPARAKSQDPVAPAKAQSQDRTAQPAPLPVGKPDPSLSKPDPSIAKAMRVDRVVTSLPRRSFVNAWSATNQRQRISFFRSLTTMLGAGLPMFGVFEFLSRQSESEEQMEACYRISKDLVAGYPLHKAAYKEPLLFSEMSVKLIEVGMRTGKLVAVLQRVAADEEDRWKLRQTLQSHLMYPVCIASLTLVAVVILPPFVLADLLSQVVALTAEPPALTKFILAFSSALSKPPFLILMALLAVAFAFVARSAKARKALVSLEPYLWEVPGLGPLIQSAVSLRFLRVFSMTYDVGLTAPQCLLLAAEATGSRKAMAAGPRMKEVLIDGGTLRESLESGGFLPPLVVEAVEAGQLSGDVSRMMDSVGKIIDSELEYRIETLMALIEPLFMAILGLFVGVFAVGCLLPILKLSETL